MASDKLTAHWIKNGNCLSCGKSCLLKPPESCSSEGHLKYYYPIRNSGLLDREESKLELKSTRQIREADEKLPITISELRYRELMKRSEL